MAEQYADRASTTVKTSYTAGGAKLIVNSITGFPSSAPFDILVAAEGANTAEIMTVTGSVSSGTGAGWDVTGAQGSPTATSASNHASGATVTAVLTVNALTSLPLSGDVTGAANSSTVFALAAGVITIAATTAALLFGSGATPSIRQAPMAATTAGNGAAGTMMTEQAQDGQNTTKNGADGGTGGTLWLGGGNPGTQGDGGQIGLVGPVILANGDAAAVELLNGSVFQPIADGVVSLGQCGTNNWSNVCSEGLKFNFDAGGGSTYGQAYIQMRNGNLNGYNGYFWPLTTANLPILSFYSAQESATAGDFLLVDNLGDEMEFGTSAGDILVSMQGATSAAPISATGNISIGASAIQFTPMPNSNNYLNANQQVGILYPAQASAGSASGAAGGHIIEQAQPGQACSGSGHTCGAGGILKLYETAGGSASSSATAGAAGGVGIYTSGGTLLSYWGPTHYEATVSVTVATSGTTTLSATQLQYSRWITNAPTLAGSASIAFGNNHVSGILNLSGLTFSGQTLTISCGSGTVTRTAMTNPLLMIECDGSNHIYVNGT